MICRILLCKKSILTESYLVIRFQFGNFIEREKQIEILPGTGHIICDVMMVKINFNTIKKTSPILPLRIFLVSGLQI